MFDAYVTRQVSICHCRHEDNVVTEIFVLPDLLEKVVTATEYHNPFLHSLLNDATSLCPRQCLPPRSRWRELHLFRLG
jgi:hypothetical protein